MYIMNYNHKLNELIEDISLDGTNINDLSKISYAPRKSNILNKNIIKNITNEIITNLKDDSQEAPSFKGSISVDENDYLDNSITEEEQYCDNKKKSKKNKDKLDNLIKDNLENFVEDTIPVKNSKNFLSYIFDDCFGIKDFILLFSIYFILSQDMIKDLFAGYFTCLNPDEEGKVGVKGIIVYGLILTTIFMLSKKYLLQ